MNAFFREFWPFCGKSTQVPFHEYFTRKTGFFRSSPVKAGQGKSRYFLIQKVRQSITPILYRFGHVFVFRDAKQSAIRRPGVLITDALS